MADVIDEEAAPRKRKAKSFKIEPKTSLKKKIRKVSRQQAEREDLADYEEGIFRAITKYVNNHSEYYVLVYYQGGMLITKAKRLTVQENKSKSMFQPQLDNPVDKEYCLVFMVEYSEYPERPPHLQDWFKTQRQPPFEIFSDRVVKEVLDGI